jgi:probable HAF family extracellular repeat protein
MKSPMNSISAITELRLASMVFVLSAISLPLVAQNKPTVKDHVGQHRYRFVDLNTLGGPNAGISCCGILPPILNNRGTAVGDADTSLSNPNFAIENPILVPCCPPAPDPFINVAVAWRGRKGIPTNLGALPGGYNSFGNAISANGTIVGDSETGDIDPRLGVVEVHPTLWAHGEIIDMGSFGGGEGAGSEANNHGQVVGFAQNNTKDPFGMFDFGTQTRAFLWEKGVPLRDLGTLGTGNDASAVFINDRGQIAGVSYTNTTANPTTELPTQDPFFWDNGMMLDLGTLGGVFGVPAALNSHGQVAGNSNLAGDMTEHAFLWDREGGMKDIGTLGGTFSQADDLTDAGDVVGASTLPGDEIFLGVLWKNGSMTALPPLPGDCYSSAYAINSKGQIVGDSWNCEFLTRPFLWDKGEVIDLQQYVPPASDMILSEPSSINDRGEILGYGFLSNGHEHVFLLIPCEENQQEGCEDGTASAGSAAAENNPGMTKSNVTPQDVISVLRDRFDRRHRNLPVSRGAQAFAPKSE